MAECYKEVSYYRTS